MKYGLIGEHLSHSFSQTVHGLIGDYEYTLCEVAPEDLCGFMQRRDFLGINVTIPYKRSVMKYLDVISDSALKIGAVNTVVNRSGKLYGYNTDADGMRALIERIVADISGKSVIIAGTGGTSDTAAYVSEILGASRITKLSRANKGVNYNDAREKCGDAEILINTTPVGMFPSADEKFPLDTSDFPHLCGVADVVYNPLRTNLVLSARDNGIKAEGGLYMLVSQAVAAAQIFFDTWFEEGKTDAIYNTILRQTENIVLIGMPGCGKSTVGKMISEKTGRTFEDTDKTVASSLCMSIPEIFSRYGEEYFRDEEEKAVARASSLTGAVISVGGGAVLRNENIKRLRRNGRIFFLDRDIREIECGVERPLSPDRESVEALYRKRIGLYRGYADRTVIIKNGAAKENTDEITEDMGI